MSKGSSGDAGGNKQLLQPLQREATPPPRGPTWAADPLWLWGLAKSVAAGDKKNASTLYVNSAKERGLMLKM